MKWIQNFNLCHVSFFLRRWTDFHWKVQLRWMSGVCQSNLWGMLKFWKIESEMNYWLLDVSGGWSVDWCTGCCGRDRILGEIKWDIDAGKSSFSQSLDRCRVQMWSWLGRIKKFGGFLTLERERGILVGFFSNFAKPFQQFPVTPVNYHWHSIFLGLHQNNPILEK